MGGLIQWVSDDILRREGGAREGEESERERDEDMGVRRRRMREK